MIYRITKHTVRYEMCEILKSVIQNNKKAIQTGVMKAKNLT